MDSALDWSGAEKFSLLVGEVCSTIPTRGAWEPNDRIALAMASFRLTREHHGSMHLLFSHNRDISAKTLARPLLEVALRTLWIAEDASDQEIADVLNGRGTLPLLGILNGCVSKRATSISGRFQSTLHSLTHGGAIALSAQFLEGLELERSNLAMLALAGVALAQAGFTIATLLQRPDLEAAITETGSGTYW